MCRDVGSEGGGRGCGSCVLEIERRWSGGGRGGGGEVWRWGNGGGMGAWDGLSGRGRRASAEAGGGTLHSLFSRGWF